MTRILGIAPSEVKGTQVLEMGWLAMGQAATILLGLVTIKLTTSIGPGEYGRFVLASSLMPMLTLAFFGPLEQGYVRMYFEYRRDAASGRRFARALRRVLGLSAVVLGVLAALALVVLHWWRPEGGRFYAATAFMVIAGVLNVPLNGMLNAMRRRRAVAIIQAVERALLVVALVLVVQRGSLDATGVVACVGWASTVALVVRLIAYTRAAERESGAEAPAPSAAEERRFRRDLLGRVAGYAAPFVVWGAVSWIQLQGERWVIDAMLPGPEVGRYGLAASLVANSVVVGFSVFTQFITPLVLDKFSDGGAAARATGERLLRAYGRLTLLLFAVCAVAFLPAGGWIVRALSNQEFSTSRWVLPVLTVGLGAFYYGQALTTLGLALQRPRVYLMPKVVAGALSLLAYVAGCAWGGILGVVVGVLAVNLVYAGLVMRTNFRLRASLPPGP